MSVQRDDALSRRSPSAADADMATVTISGVTITNSRGRVLLHIAPNSFPAARYNARRDAGDDSPIEYVQVRNASIRPD